MTHDALHAIRTFAPATYPSPIPDSVFVPDGEGVPVETLRSRIESAAPDAPRYFELAGPRDALYFDPAELTCGIVTCGGLCPGLNDVIRGLTIQLEKTYGVRRILGFRYGYQGLDPAFGHEPIELTAERVSQIHTRGGSFLRSSRGRRDATVMVDELARREVRALFTIGGDGTMLGAHRIATEILRRGLEIAVIGVPKTIDNDIAVIQKSFGFESAVAEAVSAIECGHTEARGYPNGIAVIRLMGRESGFIAAAATVASGDVNFCLVPEVPFDLDGPRGLLAQLERRLEARDHAVIVVAEGAGHGLRDRQTSGDVALTIREEIRRHFEGRGTEISMKYIDPSYLIRSVPATADDSVFCAQLSRHAVHAAMSGRTDLIVGYYADRFVHIPLAMVAGRRKKLDPAGSLWTAVLETTGQPSQLV